MATAPGSSGPRNHVDRVWAWVLLGACSAALPAVAIAAGLDTRYVLYGGLAIVLATLVPQLVRLAGSAERFFWILFLLSLQAELAYAPIVWSNQKQAGPYGILITPLLLAAVVLFALWACFRNFAQGDRLRVPRSLMVAALLFLSTALVSMTKTPERTLSAFGVFEILSLTLTAAIASHECSRRNSIATMRSALLVALLVQSLFLITEQVSGVQISLAHGVNTSYGWGSGNEGRFAGTFGAPSTAATFIDVCLFILLATIFSKEKPRHLSALWCLFGLGFLALLLTRTRSAWIGFAIGSLGLLWRCYRRHTLSRRALGRLAVAALLAFAIAWPLVSKRLSEDQAGDAQVRSNLLPIAMAMIRADPLRGVGLNTATNQVYTFAQIAGVSGWVFIVHNQFLLVAAETGLPGLVAFLVVIWVGIRAAWDCMRSRDTLIAETGAVLFWSLIAMVWALNLDHVSGCLTYALLWFLIGSAGGLDILRRREEALSQRAAAGVSPAEDFAA